MTNDLDNKIAQLPNWKRAELVAEWQRIHTEQIPEFISNKLLVRMIAHHWQEEAYSGLGGKEK